jgi:hypothetical protein
VANQTYKFSDLKQALKQGQPADVVNDIVAHLSAADINKAVKTFDPGLEVTLFNALTTESLQKVAQSLDPSVAANLTNLPPEFSHSRSRPIRIRRRPMCSPTQQVFSTPPTSTTMCSLTE